MNKSQFIEQLRKELGSLPVSEIEDIIRDHEELIRDAMAAGRSEESIIASFGSPSELARSLNAQSKIEKAQDETNFSGKIKGVMGAAAAVLVLAPFNLIFVLGPLMAIFGVLFGGWTAAIVVTAVFVCMSLVCLALTAVFPAGFFALLGVGIGLLGGVFFGFVGLGIMYMLSMFIAQLVLKYLKWNVNFVKKQAAAV